MPFESTSVWPSLVGWSDAVNAEGELEPLAGTVVGATVAAVVGLAPLLFLLLLPHALSARVPAATRTSQRVGRIAIGSSRIADVERDIRTTSASGSRPGNAQSIQREPI